MPEKKEDMSKYLKIYASEAEEHLQNLSDSLLELEKNPKDMNLINQIFRSSHTLKSSSAAMGFTKISELSHAMEDLLSRLKDKELVANKEIIDLLLNCFDALEKMINQVIEGKKEDFDTPILLGKLKKLMTLKQDNLKENEKIDSSQKTESIDEKSFIPKTVNFVKVDITRLDKLMDLVGELLITKMRLQQIKTKSKLENITDPLDNLDNLIKDIQFEVMQTRMIPMESVFNRFPRMVRDLSERENKKVNLVIQGGDIELDRTVIDKIGEPIVHQLRNSIDHGIELPEERVKAGKSETATIKLSAKRKKGSVIIEIEDDGKGLELDKIYEVGNRLGLINKDEKLNDKQILDLICNPKFSTSEKVTDVSGRGVGMNVIKTVIESLRGDLRLEHEQGKWLKMTMELPLTLAIVQSFLIKVSDEIYGVPLTSVVRTVRITENDIKTIEGHESFILNKEDIPLIRLHEVFNLANEEKKYMKVVIVEKGGDKAGLIVDSIVGEQELIIKPLDKSLKETKGFSGATILGDGSVALILDINTLI